MLCAYGGLGWCNFAFLLLVCIDSYDLVTI